MINLNDFIIEKLKVSTNTNNVPWEWEPTSEGVDYYELVDLFKGKDKYDLLNFLSEDELPKFKADGYTHTIRWVGLNHKDEICVFAYISNPKYYADYEKHIPGNCQISSLKHPDSLLPSRIFPLVPYQTNLP